jgi:hypothetical protein
MLRLSSRTPDPLVRTRILWGGNTPSFKCAGHSLTYVEATRAVTIAAVPRPTAIQIWRSCVQRGSFRGCSQDVADFVPLERGIRGQYQPDRCRDLRRCGRGTANDARRRRRRNIGACCRDGRGLLPKRTYVN